MALDICNYTPITNCLLQSSNDRFSFLFTQVCNLINSSDSNYVLPIATDTVLGGIIVGDGLSMDPDTGVLSVIPDFIPSLRFGIEDNLSDQDRQFDLGGFTFELFSDTGDITQYGSIFLDNQSVSATASDGVTVGGFDAQVNGARIFSNEGDIIKQISTTESAIEVLQTDGIDTYIQTFPLSTGFVVTSVNNVLADEFGNVNIVAVTAGTLQDVTENGPSTTIDLTLASVDITGLALDGDEGTNGQLLVSAGPGNTPVWVNPSVIPSSNLQTVTTSGASTTNNLSLASINITGLTLSGSGGTANQVLTTNGSGTPSWGMPTLQQIATSGNTSIPSIGIGSAAAPSSKLHIRDTVGGSSTGSATGIILENTVAPSDITSQSSPPITFRGAHFDVDGGNAFSTAFNVQLISPNFGTVGNPVPRVPTRLVFGSSDSGGFISPLALCSDGSMNFGSGRMQASSTTTNSFLFSSVPMEFRGTPTGTIGHSILIRPAGNTLPAGKSVMRFESINSPTYLANTGQIDVAGDANIDIFKIYNNGTTRFGIGTPNILSQIDMISTGRGLNLPRLTDAQQNNIQTGVVSIAVTNGGSGYDYFPPLVIVAPPASGGLPARATAVTTLGVVTSITVDFRGTGYTTAPAITFNETGSGGPGNPDGSGAAATATINDITIPEGLMIYATEADSGNGGIRFYNGAGVWKTLATL